VAWDDMHRVVGLNGQISMTPGFLSETITLGNNADSSTSIITNIATNSDVTVLVQFGRDLAADTYVQIEHSINGTTWFKKGEFEEDNTVDHDDISKNMAKISALDTSLIDTANEGVMMLYDIDSHGVSRFMRFTVKANGQDESANEATFYLLPHF
jgi:hypothetical protein